MFRIGSAKIVCRLEPEATTLIAYRDSSSAKAVASRRGPGKSTRHKQMRLLWLQERVGAKHLRIVKVATESNPADMLTKALGRSKVEEFCAEIGQTEPHPQKADKKPKEVKRLKKGVEAMEIKPKDARLAMNGCILWIEVSKMVESGEWTCCGTTRYH